MNIKIKKLLKCIRYQNKQKTHSKNFLAITLLLMTSFVAKSQTFQKFAIIGDYGYEGPNAKAVADMVKNLNPDFVVSVGDDNYQAENHKSIDTNCGQYYHHFIWNYKGQYGSGSPVNNFFPVLGNADYKGYAGQPTGYLLRTLCKSSPRIRITFQIGERAT